MNHPLVDNWQTRIVDVVFGSTFKYLDSKAIYGGWALIPFLILVTMPELRKLSRHETLSFLEKSHLFILFGLTIGCLIMQILMIRRGPLLEH
jgi:hypothetical protein